MALEVFPLEKFKIIVFDKRERLIPVSRYEFKFNPETYSIKYSNSYNSIQGINTSSRCAIYSNSAPEELSLKLIIDETELLDPAELLLNLSNPDIGAQNKVEKFLDLAGRMDGNIHEPKFLTASWGSFLFKCRLQSVGINYSLFNSSGIALRAELDCSFIADQTDEERLKTENKSSPDLTHRKIVKTEDTLLLMCKEIYGSANYYLEVARINKLNDFRNLTPGTEIIFPPLKKVDYV